MINWKAILESVLATSSDQVAAETKKAKQTVSAREAETGNYPKGNIEWEGLQIAIETPKGGTRTASDGSWQVPNMPAHYGYINDTEGSDGDAVDVYFGDSLGSRDVFVINQQTLDGEFDEIKVMLAFASLEEAITAYCNGFSDGSGDKRIQTISVISLPEFRKWLTIRNTTQKFSVNETTMYQPIITIIRGERRLDNDGSLIGDFFTGDFAAKDTSKWPKKTRLLRPTKPNTTSYASFDYYTQTNLTPTEAIYVAKNGRILKVVNTTAIAEATASPEAILRKRALVAFAKEIGAGKQLDSLQKNGKLYGDILTALLKNITITPEIQTKLDMLGELGVKPLTETKTVLELLDEAICINEGGGVLLHPFFNIVDAAGYTFSRSETVGNITKHVFECPRKPTIRLWQQSIYSCWSVNNSLTDQGNNAFGLKQRLATIEKLSR